MRASCHRLSGSLIVDRFTDPVDGDPVTVACLDVAVHACLLYTSDAADE